ncbi:endoplasmic reticulum lectin 1 [Bacillus rossius redtenbacheri]|uniref:endoplasmic reticulum lectin 1 n=1 Tax=Bacillus rossius redtenbacheri TaxID=93214 RepID=UPI002FDCDB68
MVPYFALVLLFVFEAESDVRSFDDTVLYKINWLGRDEQNILDAQLPEADAMLVTTQSDERYKCQLPRTQEKATGAVETYSGPTALELLRTLFEQQHCSYRLESYWTYEVCHGRYIRQYHEDREGKKVKVQEFNLGKWDKSDAARINEWERALMRDGRPAPRKKVDSAETPYLQLNMTGGTMCDLSGQARLTAVLYVCHARAKHEVVTFKEVSTCEYETVVLSPLLCGHPLFRPQESDENPINCFALEGTPKKPRNLVAMEAESIKLRHQKYTDEKLQKIYAIFSVNRGEPGQDGEPQVVKLEIRPLEVPDGHGGDGVVGTLRPAAPSPAQDVSPAASFLSGKDCLQGGSGWWKYEFCHGDKVEQFHEERDGSRVTISLGRFDRDEHLHWLERNPHKRPRPLPGRRHVSHFYSGGDWCDKAEKPRQTEVRLKCVENESGASVALFLLEPHTCEYVLGVESPLVCGLLPRVGPDGLFEAEPEDDGAVVSSEDDAAGTLASGDD